MTVSIFFSGTAVMALSSLNSGEHECCCCEAEEETKAATNLTCNSDCCFITDVKNKSIQGNTTNQLRNINNDLIFIIKTFDSINHKFLFSSSLHKFNPQKIFLITTSLRI